MKTKSIRIPEELIEILEQLAEQEDRTLSDVVRQAIKHYAAWINR